MKRSKAMRKLARKITGENIKIKKGKYWETNWENKIWWANDENTESAKAFKDFFIKHCPMAKDFNNITISLLHEIGHIMMVDESYGEQIKTEDNEKYFNSHDEWIATEWAINFLINNTKLLRKFEKKIAG